MYKTQNGWTKEKMKEAIRTRNNGKRSLRRFEDVESCAYESEDGNHCAVGCFIPEGHEGMEYRGSVEQLVVKFPGLNSKLPLSVYALLDLQGIHDCFFTSSKDMRERLCDWIDNNVED